jgi:hypothetical protein
MTKALPIKFNVSGSTIDVPEEGNVDMERVERTLAWLKEHTAFWDQNDFLDAGNDLVRAIILTPDEPLTSFDLKESDDGENECGTTFCFAGAALALYDRIAIKGIGIHEHLWPLAADGGFAYDYLRAAQELLGFTDNQAELIFFLVPVPQEQDVDVFIQYVRDILTGKVRNKGHYYEMLYAKHPELDPTSESYVVNFEDEYADGDSDEDDGEE